MTRSAEVYCFHDRDYAYDLSPLIDALRAAGHRVLSGYDADELTMLLQVGLPTAVVYTLADDRSLSGPQFQTAARRAMDRWLPMILVGPGPVATDIALRLPESSGMTERALTFDEVPEIIGELADLGQHGHLPLSDDDDNDDSGVTSLDDALVDVVGAPDEATRIETRIVVVSENARIVTTVTRDERIVLREENEIPPDEVDLFGRMEAQHLLALAAYSPATSVAPGPTRSREFRGEVSAPFVIDDSLRREQADRQLEYRLRKLILGLTAATVVALGTTVAATVLWDLPIPRPLTVESQPTLAVPDEAPVALSRVASGASKRLARLRSAYMWPPEPRGSGSESLSAMDSSSGELPFPGRFEPNEARFSVPDPEEVTRFVSTLAAMATAHDIWVVGHATHDEVGSGKSQLARQRAVEVLRFLAEHGVRKGRLHAVRGEPVAASADLEPNGTPRARYVGVIIED